MKRFLRRFLLLDLLEGLWVTFRHQSPDQIATEQYPSERPAVSERYRGAPRLNVHPETQIWCTLPMTCRGVCSAGCARTPVRWMRLN